MINSKLRHARSEAAEGRRLIWPDKPGQAIDVGTLVKKPLVLGLFIGILLYWWFLSGSYIRPASQAPAKEPLVF